MHKINIAVLISGGGTNLQALIDACAQDDFPAEISLVVSNKQDAYGLVRAQNAGIRTMVINHKDYDSRETFDMAIDAELGDVDLVCLAGFMRILSEDFATKWMGKMINIHPSLLPDFKGLNTHQRAIDEGATKAGASVHFVVPALDDGPIIMQGAVDVASDDTAESLQQKVLQVEHKIYPESVLMFAQKRLTISGNDVLVDGQDNPFIYYNDGE